VATDPDDAPSLAVEDWPSRPSEIPRVEHARQVALLLRAMVLERGMRRVAADTGATRGELAGIITGSTWPTPGLIANLERALERPHWWSIRDGG
jgi:hypothetical protein